MEYLKLKNIINQCHQTLDLLVVALKENYILVAVPDEYNSLGLEHFQKLLPEERVSCGKIHSFFIKSEIYFLIPFKTADIAYILVGPILCKQIKNEQDIKKLAFVECAESQEIPMLLMNHLFYLSEETLPILQFLYSIFTGNLLSVDEFRASVHQSEMTWGQFQMEHTVIKRQSQLNAASIYKNEQNLIRALKRGDDIRARTHIIKSIDENLNRTSLYSIRREKSIIISLISLVTRTSIAEGADIERAYSLNDIYVAQVEQSMLTSQLRELLLACVVDFCVIIKRAKKLDYPLWVRQCINYISENLHEDISLAAVARYLNMSAAYVSVEFKRITGESLSIFIQKQKIEEAKFLLENTSMTILNIALNLNFNSQSYFSKVFKEHASESPKNYRKNYLKKI